MINIIKEIYEEFYSKSQGRDGFELPLSVRNKTYLNNFIDTINKTYGLSSVGYDFLFNYTALQFSYYEGQKARINIQLNWIYGTKSLKRWLDKEKN